MNQLIRSSQLMVAVLLTSVTYAQPKIDDASPGRRADIVVAWAYEAENQGDPAYSAYKEGYNCVLEERWDEAQRKLDEVISTYSRSKYLEDAQYWSAYALMHTNRKKAAEAYRRFIKSFPGSSYFDDAVADFARLQVEESVQPHAADTLVLRVHGHGASVVIDLRRLEHELQKMHVELPVPPHSPSHASIIALEESSAAVPHGIPVDTELDRSLQLTLESLHDIRERKQEEKAFHTLRRLVMDQEQSLKAREYALFRLSRTNKKSSPVAYQTVREVALDQKQPLRLRELAISSLAAANQSDALPVFKAILRKDRSDTAQICAIEAISQRGKDKDRTVETLAELFDVIPKQRKEQLKTILFSIANIGNDKAVEFLASVAHTADNSELRSNAIFYLTNIGGEKARTALYRVLEQK